MHVEPIIFYRGVSPYFGVVLLSYNSYASFELPLQHLCPQGFWRQYLKAVQRQNGSQLSPIILELNIKNLLR